MQVKVLPDQLKLTEDMTPSANPYLIVIWKERVLEKAPIALAKPMHITTLSEEEAETTELVTKLDLEEARDLTDGVK